MAKRRTSGEPSSKQGVLISLGICIPIIVILLVTTYLGYFHNQAERDAKVKQANDERDKAQYN